MQTIMKAVTFHEHGGPEKLLFEDVPLPQIGPDEVLVRVKACALNHLDIWIRQGIPNYHLTLPHISGCDVSGIIDTIGTAYSGPLAPGQSVFVMPGISCGNCDECLIGKENRCAHFQILGAQRNGGYAEYVNVPAANVFPMPENLTFEQAAAFPLVTLTAWHMVKTLANVQPGESVLVVGAGSGVGSMAIQMAHLLGARVFSTVGTEEKKGKANLLGSEDVINHSTENVADRVAALTDGRGVDVVIEHIGQAVWDSCLKSLSRGGRMVTCGATSGGTHQFDARYLYSRQLTVIGSYMGTRDELLEVTRLVEADTLRPILDTTFPLQEARAAQERMLARKNFGKIVLVSE
jgi:NADPH:quinone reductase-like Zn-dependent oxidoreductase